jgi:iron(III) transport system substrate-binding protein
VVVYAAQDQVYAEPILKEFTRQTGLEVRAVYDSEAVKTVGLANRLLAERSRPRCDLFWSNEELRTRQLGAQNVFRQTNGWVAVGYRSRRLVVNTNFLPVARAPRSLMDLTNATWHGKVALAYPLFGTTATHFLALRQHWGQPRWEAWCRALQTNAPLVVDGNSVVAKLVGRGEVWLGLTDSDDIAAVQREGAPVAALPLSEELLLIPNTLALVRQAPHSAAAQQLWEYLQRREVVDKLVAAGALEGQASNSVAVPTLKPDWDLLLAELGPATERLKRIFLR